MQRILSPALPAAICMAIAGACHDAPLAPRPPAPDAILTSDGSTTTPQILSHYEKFSFGWHTTSSSVPSAVNADMTFIGDDGEIDLANVTVTPDSGGAPFSRNAQMALGPGQIINCADVTLGGCNNHHLSGVASLSGAPDCSAHASGTIAYWASVIRTSGFSWGPISTYTGSGLTTVSSSAPFTATAPACSTQQSTTGGTTSDSTGTSGTGTVGPPPAPTGPNVPVAPPPPPPPPTGGGFVCQQTDLYQITGTNVTLLSTTIDCYPE